MIFARFLPDKFSYFKELEKHNLKKYVRIAWKIGRRSGHGSWLSHPRKLDDTIRTMNKEYGPGSHWLEYK